MTIISSCVSEYTKSFIEVEELKIAQELNYLFSDNEVEVSKILEKYNVAKFDAIAITKLVFDLSKQLSKIYLSNNDKNLYNDRQINC